MAEDLVKSTMEACGITEYEIVGEPVSGAELEYMKVQHPFLERKSLVILGDHVTLESGTGCVHTAGGHGVDDFLVCQKYPELPIVVPVDDGGYLTADAGEEFAGLRVWEANPVILKHIKETGHLMA